MTMHPELEHALNSGLPIPEVIEIFTRHHSGLVEEHNNQILFSQNHDIDHNNRSFWDTWEPLLHRLPVYRGSWIFGEQCIPSEPFFNTHKYLTKEIISWLCDSNRRSNVYFIEEPWTPKLHADQNSRAQVFANICSSSHRFGLLYAHENRALLPYDGIGELSSELAGFYPSFRRILTRILIDNPGILQQPTRTQFKKLIHEPWRVLQASHPRHITAPPVIIFRYDDEYRDEEMLRSICEFGMSPHSSSLLWIISIYTTYEPPTSTILDLLNSSPPCRYFRLSVSYDEGPTDAASVLHHDFSALRHKHEQIFYNDEAWPSEEQMSELIRIVSGVLESVDVIIRFIDSKDGGGPKAHLETFLAYMVDSPSPSDERPYSALDHFYIHALSDIPPDLVLVVKKAFSVVCWRGHNITGPLQLACFLSLEDHTFLHYLYRFAVIRADERYDERSCLKGFLHDPKRSGQFYISSSEDYHHFLDSYLHMLSHSPNLTAVLKPAGPWMKVDAKAYRDKIEAIRSHDYPWLWYIFATEVHNEAHADLWRHFDFRCLAHTCATIDLRRFFDWVKRLHVFDKSDSPNLVRVKPVCLLDEQFIEKCEGLAEPMELNRHILGAWPSSPKYVLLGFASETILAVMAPLESFDYTRGVDIYTSAMLDYM